MLPSVKANCPIPVCLVTTARNSSTLFQSGNGASESPRYHEMVGTGLPEEKQVMLTESPSCIVTVPSRLMVVGPPAANVVVLCFIYVMYLHKFCKKVSVHNWPKFQQKLEILDETNCYMLTLAEIVKLLKCAKLNQTKATSTSD